MTVRTWIVAVDGSEDSKSALAWAAAQAAGRDVRIVALCTWRAPLLPSDAIGQPALLMDWGDFETELHRRIDEIIVSVRDAATVAGSSPEIESKIVQGRAARTLIDESRAAELLVVGSRGRGGIGALLGSVSRQCATHASVPVVVVPAGVAIEPVRRMVVGYDGSANARAALHWAMGFAADDAEIDVVQAVELAPWLGEAGVRERFSAEVDSATAEFEAQIAELDPDRRTRPSLKLQDARQALAEAAVEADIVVLGARGHGRFGAVLLGTVSTWMLHGASRPTVIVPEPDKPEPDK